ncbi:gustatory receptor for sugar taste 64e-like [Aricia agestis]|uniref:gustatory receptor for sugar taste 64e-like n=1 Tax=Aricia agestis TaxID=91739 RepID=UPI001C20888F|nr:gustatory receptor for sugar taste 64e-like [Aricia agestis]
MRQKYIKHFSIPTRIFVSENKVNVSDPKSQSVGLFQQSMRLTLMIGQVFSLLPVNGVFSRNNKKVTFTWRSWKCLYILVSLLGQMFITIMCIYRVFITKTNLNGKTSVIFYATTCITMVLFLRIARRWPKLVYHISRTEDHDYDYDSRLIYKCNVTCAVILSLSILEHILSLQSSLADILTCSPDIGYERFVKYIYPWIFNFIPYSPVLGGFIEVLHLQSTFVWNFSDLFVICMSYYLTSRLESVNRKLLAAKGKFLPESFWRTAREDFARVVQLVREVDDVINGVIFICFANNLFFICLQLFNTLAGGITDTPTCNGASFSHVKRSTVLLGGYESAVYFVFSLLYLLARSIAMSLIVSYVHSASLVPAIVLYDVPSPVYCVEVQRFLDQVNGEKIALTGLKFFSVTRGLLLKVAGTIVTYELVMLQFNSSTIHAEEPTFAPSTGNY